MQATTRKPADKNPEATEAARRVLIREGLTTAHDSVGVHLYSSPVATWVEGLPETEAAAQMMRNIGAQWSAKRSAWYVDLRRVQLPAVKTAAVQTVSTTVAAPAARKSTPKPVAKPAPACVGLDVARGGGWDWEADLAKETRSRTNPGPIRAQLESNARAWSATAQRRETAAFRAELKAAEPSSAFRFTPAPETECKPRSTKEEQKQHARKMEQRNRAMVLAGIE